MKRIIKRSVLALALIGAAAAMLLPACNVSISGGSTRQSTPKAVPEDLAKVWETYVMLKERYVNQEALDPKKLADGAIQGMLDTLDDPFTAYFDAESYGSRVDDIEGNFEGIGATVALREGRVTIVAPIPDSPAEKAGLRAGDVIQGIEGESVEGLSLREVVDKIRGPRNTAVRITVQSGGSGAVADVTVERAPIQLPSVSAELLANDVALVRISQFVRRTSEELDVALRELEKKQVKGIILDLRNNPGGLLTVVQDVAGQFLKDGVVVGYELDARGKRTDWKVERGGRFTDLPMTVLVNGGSASGSEVVAGAIKAHGRGKIIGQQTFGKGVVNVPVRLRDGSGLYITTATWYTPSGEQIGHVGLAPDIAASRTLDDVRAGRDPQVEKAMEVLRESIGVRS